MKKRILAMVSVLILMLTIPAYSLTLCISSLNSANRMPEKSLTRIEFVIHSRIFQLK